MKKQFLVISLIVGLFLVVSGGVAVAVDPQIQNPFYGEMKIKGELSDTDSQYGATLKIVQKEANAEYTGAIPFDAITLDTVAYENSAGDKLNNLVLIRNWGDDIAEFDALGHLLNEPRESELAFLTGGWSTGDFTYFNAAIYTWGNDRILRLKPFKLDDHWTPSAQFGRAEMRIKNLQGDLSARLVSTDTNAASLEFATFPDSTDNKNKISKDDSHNDVITTSKIYRPTGSDDLRIAVTDQDTPASLIDVMTFQAGTGNVGIGTAPSNFKVDLAATDDVRGFRVISSVTDLSPDVMEAANFAVDINGSSIDGMYYGFANRVVHSGEQLSIWKMTGGENSIQFNSIHPGTTSVTRAAALRASIFNSSDFERTYSNALLMGIDVQYRLSDASANGSITADALRGLSIGAPSADHLTVTDLSGVWIDKQAAGDNNYGIVLDGDGAGADIVFGDAGGACRPGIYSDAGFVKAVNKDCIESPVSPHDPETGEWIFYSKNTKTGHTVRVNMEELVKDMEKLTGKKYLIESFVTDK